MTLNLDFSSGCEVALVQDKHTERCWSVPRPHRGTAARTQQGLKRARGPMAGSSERQRGAAAMEASGTQASRLPALSELVFEECADRRLGIAAAAHTPPTAAQPTAKRPYLERAC